MELSTTYTHIYVVYNSMQQRITLFYWIRFIKQDYQIFYFFEQKTRLSNLKKNWWQNHYSMNFFFLATQANATIVSLDPLHIYANAANVKNQNTTNCVTLTWSWSQNTSIEKISSSIFFTDKRGILSI